MTKNISLTIGKLAREAGVSVETVRYYQRRGLLGQPFKPAGGFRRYSEQDVARICFIKRAQQMGFTLSEIAELVPHIDTANCQATKALTEKKLKAIETQLIALEKIRATLKGLVAECARDCQQFCTIRLKFHGATRNNADDIRPDTPPPQKSSTK